MRIAYYSLPLMLLLLTACTTMPSAINDPQARVEPTAAEVRQDPSQHQGEIVRWGGNIAGVENRANETLVEIVGRELESDGRPQTEAFSHGRFLAVVPEFLDPVIYETGRLLTVVGELDGVVTRKVGDFDYPYPRVRVTGLHLWEPRVYPVRGPFFYDPFYAPFYDPFYGPSFYGPAFGPPPHDPLFRHHRW